MKKLRKEIRQNTVQEGRNPETKRYAGTVKKSGGVPGRRYLTALLAAGLLFCSTSPVLAGIFNNNTSSQFTRGIGGISSVAMGLGASASGDNSTAIGKYTEASKEGTTAIGNYTKASGELSTALGNDTEASGYRSTAMGYLTKAIGQDSTAIGYWTSAENKYSTAMGYLTQAVGESSTAMGFKTYASGANSTAMGQSSRARAANSLAASGGEVEEEAENSIAMGKGARAKLKDTVALGSDSVAKTASGAVGYDPKGADHSGDTSGVWKSTRNAIAVGNAANTVTRQITGVAAGTKDTDAVNVAQLKQIQAGVNTYTTGGTYDAASKKIKFTQNDASKNYEVDLSAFIVGSDVSAQNGTIDSAGTGKSGDFVKGSTVYNYLHGDSLALGKNSAATAAESIAIGKGNTASGDQSIAVGFGNTVKGDHSGAFGDPTIINANNSYSVGNHNTLDGDNTFVLGNNVKTGAKNAVVLGNDSEGVDNAVSVGAKGKERQIKNVAKGSEDTDAVNVAQLKQAITAAEGLDLTPVNHRISRLDSKVNKVGAGAAALAALHPLDMDNKFDVAAGFGNYRNANALALGLFYRPTENVMFSMGGTMGNGENMVNAGVTFALDQGQGIRVSKAAMAKKINALTEENAAMKAENRAIREKAASQDAEIAALREALARLEAKVGK